MQIKAYKFIFIFFLVFQSCRITNDSYVFTNDKQTVLVLNEKDNSFHLKNYKQMKWYSGSYSKDSLYVYLCVDRSCDVRYITNIFTIKIALHKTNHSFIIVEEYGGCHKP